MLGARIPDCVPANRPLVSSTSLERSRASGPTDACPVVGAPDGDHRAVQRARHVETLVSHVHPAAETPEKSYGGRGPVVADLDLDVDDGEVFVLVGPSGCGKTTVLRMIAGLDDVSSGDVVMDGVVINDVDAGERDIAMRSRRTRCTRT